MHDCKQTNSPPPPYDQAKYPVRLLDRDFSWLKFNERVLDQAERPERNVFEQLKFLAISAANLDEFFMVRMGRLYDRRNHIPTPSWRRALDLGSLRHQLLVASKKIFKRQHTCLLEKLMPRSKTGSFTVVQTLNTLSQAEQEQLRSYFDAVLFPILSPIVFDRHDVFPVLGHKLLVLGVVTYDSSNQDATPRISFIQLPAHLPRFYVLSRHTQVIGIPIENIVYTYLSSFFEGSNIRSVTLMRIIRDADFYTGNGEDTEAHTTEILKKRLKQRALGRVVRLDVTVSNDPWLVALLMQVLDIDKDNLFEVPIGSILDMRGLQELTRHKTRSYHTSVPPLACAARDSINFFKVLKHRDILLHHPYNSIDLLVGFIKRAAEDPHVITIQMTIYRLAPYSVVTKALAEAAVNGKQVVVLIEVKARFDEEHNMREAQKLEQAGCSVLYGTCSTKTHAKVMLIVREEEGSFKRYAHLSSGNYNEDTAQGYVDIGLMTADEAYTREVAAFLDTIMGRGLSQTYTNLIATPLDMREQLINMIRQEMYNAQQGLPCGIVIKVNALEDQASIEALYEASQSGVPIRLIVRGICCLIPQRPNLSSNITVRSIVGDFLEHARIFYFHNRGFEKIYVGSADVMVKSFDKRIESLFLIKQPMLQKEVLNILVYNLRDTFNSYAMQEDGAYTKVATDSENNFNIHQAFFKLKQEDITDARLFA